MARSLGSAPADRPTGTPRDYAGAFVGTPVFLGCSDIDGHVRSRA